MSDKCPSCEEELFPVCFGDENLYKGVTYKRCMKCNSVTPFKEKLEEKESK